MIPTGTEKNYVRFKKQIANIISSNFETSKKIEELRHIRWDIREKFEVGFGDETELTNRAFKLYEEVEKIIRSLQK
jgi:hypothetical protein